MPNLYFIVVMIKSKKTMFKFRKDVFDKNMTLVAKSYDE